MAKIRSFKWTTGILAKNNEALKYDIGLGILNTVRVVKDLICGSFNLREGDGKEGTVRGNTQISGLRTQNIIRKVVSVCSLSRG